MSLFLLPILVGCKPEESPATLDALTLGALQEFDAPEAADHVAGLRTWLLEQAEEWPDGYTLDPVEAGDLDTMDHSDGVEWERVLGAGVPLRVAGTMDGYTRVASEADQTFADPSTYIKWDRTLIDGTASAFADGDPMRTDNDIEKSGPFGIVISYDASKDYRWFGDVLAARTFVPEEGWDEDHENGIICGFTIEIWFDDGDEVVWYNGSWTQLASVVDDYADDSFWVQQFINGTIDYMEGTEAHVTGE